MTSAYKSGAQTRHLNRIVVKYTDIQIFSFVRRRGRSEINTFELYRGGHFFEEIGLLAATPDSLRSIASLKRTNLVDRFGDLQAQKAVSRCVRTSADVD